MDGGYNGDDALGTSSGAQVRTPLEAIQEFQVLTSMYDAEFGRAGGAIVNAVTKAGTNQFKGVVFGEAASNALTAADYFVRTQESREADGGQTRLGRRARRSDRQEQGALLLQPRAAGGQPEPDAHVRRRGRPELLDRRGSHRLEHADPLRPPDQHEPHVGGPLAARVGAAVEHRPVDRKTLGSPYQDETDLDQTAVGTLTSVLGNSRVNTVARGADVGALVARQRVLPRPGPAGGPGRLRVRHRRRPAIRRCARRN